MKRSIKHIAVFVLIAGLIYACSPLNRIGGKVDHVKDSSASLSSYCDSAQQYKSLYISGIDAEIFLDEEEYRSRVSIFYLPDSLFLLSAVNAGFEIVRLGVTKDSTVYINRLEKLAFVIRNDGKGADPPVLFEDLEHLINKSLLCGQEKSEMVNDSTLLLDRSHQDISKKIFYRIPGPWIWKFEFFQKKTGEFVVGEMNDENKIIIYSNYIVDDLTLLAEGGKVEFDRMLDVHLSVNSRKYTIIHL